MDWKVGIDLGTTYSAIAAYDEDYDRVILISLESADGQEIIRSVVYYPGPNQKPVVGDTAWNALKSSPDRVIQSIKRSMGRPGFKVGPIDGEEYTPPQVSAEILKVLVEDASRRLGEPVTDAVITVPAYFQDPQRAATEEAGKLAGLNVLSLLPEPQAAALAYATEQNVDIAGKYLLVYDLGGGTFDVALIHVPASSGTGDRTQPKIEIICKAGNMSCGGLNWDKELFGLVAEKAMDEHGIDVLETPIVEATVMENCEKGKRFLSDTTPVDIAVDMGSHHVKVSRAEFEDCTSNLLFETQALLEQVLKEAEEKHGINKEDIQIMLTGGSSRMPMVRDMIEKATGKTPLAYRNPELLVCIGAAYWAHLHEGGVTPLVPDIANYCVGVEVMRKDSAGQWQSFNAIVIPRGRPFGEYFDKEFRKTEDGMTEITVSLNISDEETEDMAQCRRLASFSIKGLPAEGREGERVRVRIGHDESGIIRGEAIDLTTSKKAEIVVDRETITGNG